MVRLADDYIRKSLEFVGFPELFKGLSSETYVLIRYAGF